MKAAFLILAVCLLAALAIAEDREDEVLTGEGNALARKLIPGNEVDEAGFLGRDLLGWGHGRRHGGYYHKKRYHHKYYYWRYRPYYKKYRYYRKYHYGHYKKRHHGHHGHHKKYGK
jgi:hypothetical protein